MNLINFLRKISPKFVFKLYHWLVAFGSALLNGFPSNQLKVIGVTGTNGKSTVAYLLPRILEEAGYRVAAVSSIEFKIKEKTWPNSLKMTMPGRGKLQKFLKQAVRAGCQYVVLEVTSQGIEQYRHKFINFKTAVFTNLTWEHIESHGGFENYKAAKGELFKALKGKGTIIVNLDDHNTDYFLNFPSDEKYGYGIINQRTESDLRPDNFQLKKDGLSFVLRGVSFNLNLLGRFNVYNALAAITAATIEGISLKKAKAALEKIQFVPGRLEIAAREPFTVIVDYAHTPDALGKLYQNLRDIFSARMIGLLGAAGGGRDKWKRPTLGKIACHYCDKVIVTNEDPYDEAPQDIIEEVAKGCQIKTAEKILDRRQAIQRAFRLAQPGDIVVITGKGCEPWICVGQGGKIAWDDRRVVKEELERLKGS